MHTPRALLAAAIALTASAALAAPPSSTPVSTTPPSDSPARQAAAAGPAAPRSAVSASRGTPETPERATRVNAPSRAKKSMKNSNAAMRGSRPEAESNPRARATALNPAVREGLQKWTEATRPGENHKALDAFVGTWDADVRLTNLPVARAGGTDKSHRGVVKTTWTHGGRFLRSEFAGGVGGPTFSATSTIGFSAATNSFEGTWIGSTSNSLRVSSGAFDAATRTFTFTSTSPDTMTGATTTFKETYTLNSSDQYTYKLFQIAPNTSERRLQEVVCTRRR